jgi:hypothetical protein
LSLRTQSAVPCCGPIGYEKCSSSNSADVDAAVTNRPPFLFFRE